MEKRFLKQYIVDAFTDRPFSDNPAAVCVLERWPSDAWMQRMAAENNLSETAFLVRDGSAFRTRFFTPATEVALCGHATLASAYVALNCLNENLDSILFELNDQRIGVKRSGDLFTMDFPEAPQREIPVSRSMEEAFGLKPSRAFLGTDLVCVFEDEEQIRNLRPDQALLSKLDGRGQNATAPASRDGSSTGADCVSRSFFPKLGIPEDPVCGSAHCQIAPYWSVILGKDEIIAYQASKRGGFMFCKLQGVDRVGISGKACLTAITQIQPAALDLQ